MSKNREEFNIVFLGTPAFAVPSLDILRVSGYPIKAVVTAPDKPAGRGLKQRISEVKQYAETHSLQILQPESLKDINFTNTLTRLSPDLIVVVAFRMLPESIWRIPVYGTINLHASLLPQYRGAAPINHAIINGEQLTGVTTFLIDKQIDTGNILLQESIEIRSDETAGQLHDRLMYAGAKLVLNTVDQLRQGTIKPVPQSKLHNPEEMLYRAPKITPDFCSINWNDPAIHIVNLIRGLSPYPGAHATLCSPAGSHYSMKIFQARISDQSQNEHPGSIVVGSQNQLLVASPDGNVELLEIQIAGKSRMKARDFLNGFRITKGWKMC